LGRECGLSVTGRRGGGGDAAVKHGNAIAARDHARILVSRCAGCQLKGQSTGQGPTPAGSLHALAGAVRMVVFRMHNPALRAAAAHDASEEHRPSVARHAVVMTRHVAADPAPHKSPFPRSDDARAKGNFDAACTDHRSRGKTVQNCAMPIVFVSWAAWSKTRNCTCDYGLEIDFRGRTG
jgi:hypothetical protein